MPPAWCLFLRIVLAILGLLWFHINVWIVCSSSVKIVMGPHQTDKLLHSKRNQNKNKKTACRMGEKSFK